MWQHKSLARCYRNFRGKHRLHFQVWRKSGWGCEAFIQVRDDPWKWRGEADSDSDWEAMKNTAPVLTRMRAHRGTFDQRKPVTVSGNHYILFSPLSVAILCLYRCLTSHSHSLQSRRRKWHVTPKCWQAPSTNSGYLTASFKQLMWSLTDGRSFHIRGKNQSEIVPT
jgi:hypothetical protein